jgi:putative ubiquitin-RnfH superfamily antitoxin RatB of RatAB toxin-antitoxin module
MAESSFQVEVAYATSTRQVIIALQVVAGTTVGQAIELSTIVAQCPEIELSKTAVGIFGQVCPLNRQVKQGDRVEIYRPLLCDPKQARRNRAVISY